MRDPIATLKNAARVSVARGLSALANAHEAAQASGEDALHALGLPTRTDIDRLHRAATDLDRAADTLRARS